MKCSEFPMNYGDFPMNCSEFPMNCSEFPMNCSDFPKNCSDFPMNCSDFRDCSVPKNKRYCFLYSNLTIRRYSHIYKFLLSQNYDFIVQIFRL